MSLVCKLKLLCLTDLVNIRVFLRLALPAKSFVLAFRLLWRYFSHEQWEVLKQFGWFEFWNCVDWDVRHLMFKTTVHVDTAIDLPTSMSEPLNCVEFVPFWRFSIVNLHRNILTNSVCSTSNDNHQGTQKESWMLISWRWGSVGFVRCFNPVPSAVSVSP